MNNVKTTTPLKDMPYHTTKQELFDMYLNQMPEDMIKKEINLIIMDKRRLEPGLTPRHSKITHVELKEFVEIWGVPKGYAHPDWLKP